MSRTGRLVRLSAKRAKRAKRADRAPPPPVASPSLEHSRELESSACGTMCLRLPERRSCNLRPLVKFLNRALSVRALWSRLWCRPRSQGLKWLDFQHRNGGHRLAWRRWASNSACCLRGRHRVGRNGPRRPILASGTPRVPSLWCSALIGGYMGRTLALRGSPSFQSLWRCLGVTVAGVPCGAVDRIAHRR